MAVGALGAATHIVQIVEVLVVVRVDMVFVTYTPVEEPLVTV